MVGLNMNPKITLRCSLTITLITRICDILLEALVVDLKYIDTWSRSSAMVNRESLVSP